MAIMMAMCLVSAAAAVPSRALKWRDLAAGDKELYTFGASLPSSQLTSPRPTDGPLPTGWHGPLPTGCLPADHFVTEFDRTYTSAELGSRKQIFEANVANIHAHNALGTTWTEGVNQFTDHTPVRSHLQASKLWRGSTPGGHGTSSVNRTSLLA